MQRKMKLGIMMMVGIVLVFISADVNAQCALCKAVAEDSANSNGFAAGLNQGIIVLMSVPYLLFTAMYFLFFRKRLKRFFRELNALH